MITYLLITNKLQVSWELLTSVKLEANVHNGNSNLVTPSESASSGSSFIKDSQIVSSSADSLVEKPPKRPVRKRVKPDRLQVNG